VSGQYIAVRAVSETLGEGRQGVLPPTGRGRCEIGDGVRSVCARYALGGLEERIAESRSA
jgi:hypothetical protein